MTGLLTVGVAAIIAILYSIVGDEMRACLPYLARRLIRTAAGRLPPEDRTSYEQDWLAEVAAREDRPLWALAAALDIRLRIRGIRESVLGVSLRGRRSARAMDVIVSTLMLVLLAPLLVFVAIAIRIDSEGPVFARFERIGRENSRFTLLRFRTISSCAALNNHRLDRPHPAATGSTGSGSFPDDPRMTRIGRFLRRYSLDELPQIINVLRGEMSLVGPPPYGVGTYLTGDPRIDVRNSVRPGLVDPCVTSAPAPRPIDFDEAVDRFSERLIHEAVYARSRSFLGDVRTLIRVPWILIRQGRDQR